MDDSPHSGRNMCEMRRLDDEGSPLVGGLRRGDSFFDKFVGNKEGKVVIHNLWRTLMLGIGCMCFVFLWIAKESSASSPIRFNGSYPNEDLIQHLPGYGKTPSDWYSGYLEYELNGRTIHTHYIYVEAPSVNQNDDPDVDDETPLIFWSNGGPGASSIFGLLTEYGPLRVNGASLQTDDYKKTRVPTLMENVHSWNQLGSFLLLDAPAPVGYSYCDDDMDGDGFSCGQAWDDESAAWNNYHALLAFYRKFPQFEKRPLYLTGQSYAGLYIPMLAQKILDNRVVDPESSSKVRQGQQSSKHHHHDASSSSSSLSNSLPLKGFAVGNPCFGNEINCGPADPPFYNLFFMAGHGQISLKLYDQVMDTCGGETALRPFRTDSNSLSEECQSLLKQVDVEAGGYFEYDLYDDCAENLLDDDGDGRRRRLRKEESQQQRTIEFANGLTDFECGGQTALDEWMSHPVVKKALHIPDGVAWFDGDDGVDFGYDMTKRDMTSFYQELATGKYAFEEIKALVYTGDADPSIDSMLAQDFMRQLGLKEVEPWRPWTLDGCRRMGGSVTRYEGSINFLTIRGSGHFVPTYKPAASLAFLKAWIQDEPFPEYDASCKYRTGK